MHRACVYVDRTREEDGSQHVRAANTLRKLCSLVRSRGVGRDEAEGVDG
jgi:hypothetical protein